MSQTTQSSRPGSQGGRPGSQGGRPGSQGDRPVSYTHLTLPTICSV